MILDVQCPLKLNSNGSNDDKIFFWSSADVLRGGIPWEAQQLIIDYWKAEKGIIEAAQLHTGRISEKNFGLYSLKKNTLGQSTLRLKMMDESARAQWWQCQRSRGGKKEPGKILSGGSLREKLEKIKHVESDNRPLASRHHQLAKLLSGEVRWPYTWQRQLQR